MVGVLLRDPLVGGVCVAPLPSPLRPSPVLPPQRGPCRDRRRARPGALPLIRSATPAPRALTLDSPVLPCSARACKAARPFVRAAGRRRRRRGGDRGERGAWSSARQRDIADAGGGTRLGRLGVAWGEGARRRRHPLLELWTPWHLQVQSGAGGLWLGWAGGARGWEGRREAGLCVRG